MSLAVALSKGKLWKGAGLRFRAAGLPFPDAAGRRLVVELGALRFLFVKDVDVPTYVEHGIADCGIVGSDVLREADADVYEPLDLAFGHCRLAVARLADGFRGRGELGPGPAGGGVRRHDHATLRVASKYPRLAAAHFLGRGRPVEVVKLQGSVELACVLGLADCIVDVVETGATLRENGLEVVEEVLDCSARLIVNRASYHARRQEVQSLLQALESAVPREVLA